MKEHNLFFNAVHDLKIDVPVLCYKIHADTITLYLYGGQVVSWSPKPDQPAPLPSKNPKPEKPGRK